MSARRLNLAHSRVKSPALTPPRPKLSRSEWYLNGNYLVVFVSIGVILPLSLLKNLGKGSRCSDGPS